MPKTLSTITLGPSFGHSIQGWGRASRLPLAGEAGLLLACSPAQNSQTIPYNTHIQLPCLVPCALQDGDISDCKSGRRGCTSPGGWERFAKPIAAVLAFLAALATTDYYRCRWGRGRWQSDDGLAAHAITTMWLTVQARARLGGGAILGTPKTRSVARKSNIRHLQQYRHCFAGNGMGVHGQCFWAGPVCSRRAGRHSSRHSEAECEPRSAAVG